ncbi:PREDICTED: ATP synthase subunit b, mitochondrial [Nicrophorus vespilloides]|uniref:ATP synthase subunit b n=1 Tax=Nicrophorus vespilloides TaxID=110193 RepID=A0ABM1MZX5_NICVS|nr:PREDICTED: ATP synthase subunit b, mitochondrial [Nicrophorus vespilloides]
MLSRAALLSGQQNRALVALAARTTGTTACNNVAASCDSQVEMTRPVRMEPGKVRMGFIPEEWFNFFYKKTGVTGPYTLGFTLSTYLLSKEIYVLEHEFYSGLSLALMCVVAVKKIGPGLAKYLDKEIDAYETEWNESRVNERQVLEQQIGNEEKMQWSAEGQNMMVQAKRENVALQLEAAYRGRVMTAYQEVKKRLDYQVEIQNIERRIAQRNLIDYVVRRVMSSITPDQDKKNIDKCIADLSSLAKA